MYIHEWVGGRIDCDGSKKDESAEEKFQLMKLYIYTLHGTMSPEMAVPRPSQWFLQIHVTIV